MSLQTSTWKLLCKKLMLCSPKVPPLVHFQHTVDFIYKKEAGEEAYSTWKEEEMYEN